MPFIIKIVLGHPALLDPLGNRGLFSFLIGLTSSLFLCLQNKFFADISLAR